MAVSPKLYINKPRKPQLKQLQQQQTSAPPHAPPSSSSSVASGAVPPPQTPKESFIRRYKYLWPMLLAVNFSIGAYLFMRTKKKDVGTEEGEMLDVPGTSISTAVATAASEKEMSDVPGASVKTAAAIIVSEKEREVTTTPTLQSVIVCEPMPENQQRELFKWMLEEKRRVKPKDHEEKRRIDEEKAILKHFIRAKSIPVF